MKNDDSFDKFVNLENEYFENYGKLSMVNILSYGNRIVMSVDRRMFTNSLILFSISATR